jgi:hypothetical protein
MANPAASVQLEDLLDDPDIVAASEYRAVYDLLVDGTSDLPDSERLAMAISMCDELVSYATQTRAKLKTLAGAADAADADRQTIGAFGVTVILTRSAGLDGAPVVFIDTDEDLEGADGPRVRVHVNDGEVYVGIPLGGDPE